MGVEPYRTNTPPPEEAPLHPLVPAKQGDTHRAFVLDLLLLVLEVVLGLALS